ncbi:MAG TPA: hypothetical protein VMD75_15330 [Candidatus Binataceae bacterium]|nr:hypothetical protein [Candidatus Binataceae bacterium]
MLRNSLGFAFALSLMCSAALAASSSDSSPPASVPVLTQDQASLYLACLEESSLASAKDGNPVGTLGALNTTWVKTVKHTSLKGLTMLQLVQVTDESVRALAALQFGNASLTGKVFKEFGTQTPAGCLSIAQSLQQ